MEREACRICGDELGVNGMNYQVMCCYPCMDRAILWAAGNAYKEYQGKVLEKQRAQEFQARKA